MQLGRVTDGLTGSEIESAFIDALYLAFDEEKEPMDLDIVRILTEFVPFVETDGGADHRVQELGEGKT